MLGFVLMSVNQAQSLDSMIAFSSDRDNPGGYRDIFVMKPNGSQLRNLTNDPMTSDIFPAWSPDGTKIAFSSYRDGNSDIYVIDADGKNLIRLTQNPGTTAYLTGHRTGRELLLPRGAMGTLRSML